MRLTFRELGTALLAGAVAIAVAACAGTEMKQEPAAQAKPAAAAEVKKEAAAYKKPRGKEFVNESPAFSVVYPRYLKDRPLEVPAEVLRVADKEKLPVFVCTVDDAAKDATLKGLPQPSFEIFRKDARYADKSGWNLESQTETKLADGTPAVEYEVGWDWMEGVRLYTTTVATIKDGKIIACNVTTTEPGNKATKKYLYSLKVP